MSFLDHWHPDDAAEVTVAVTDCETGREHCFRLDIYSGDSGNGMFADAGDNNISLSAFRTGTTGTGHVFVQVYGHVVPLP